MTLLEELKALVENRDPDARLYRVEWIQISDLLKIISRHEHDDWRGPWKCAVCDSIYYHKTKSGICQCSHYGNLTPHERRKGERRSS